MTCEVPDLTGQHPETLRQAYEERRRYHAKVTYAQWLKDWPDSGWVSADDFERARQRIVGQSLDDFATTNRAKEIVWREHGTPELAAQAGLIDTEQQVLLAGYLELLGKGEDAAWDSVQRLKWAAEYDDPEQATIYLYDLVPERDAQAAKAEMRRREEAARQELAAAMIAPAKTVHKQSEIVQELREINATLKKHLSEPSIGVHAEDGQDGRTAAAKRKQPRRKAGRKPSHSPKEDRQLWNEWNGASKDSPGLTYEEFAQRKGMDKWRDLERALQRHRARERRREQTRPK